MSTLTKAVNQISTNLTKNNINFWKRAQSALDKFRKFTPGKGERAAFNSGIKKMQTSIDAQSYKQWNEIMRQLKLG